MKIATFFAPVNYRCEVGSCHDQGTSAVIAATSTVLLGCLMELSLTPPSPGRLTAMSPAIKREIPV
ncbi:MAG: hypothetical protein ABSE48_08955 [Verrucomicrobiota bacterium]